MQETDYKTGYLTLLEICKEVRKYQKLYFKCRDSMTLAKAKKAEMLLDKYLERTETAEPAPPLPDLFG